MTLLRAFLAAGLLACAATADDYALWVTNMRRIALNKALNNIGPHGKNVPGAASGIVVASPSKSNPDYFYTWTRDSAVTMQMIVSELQGGDDYLLSYVNDYIKAQAVLQATTNPSGTLEPLGAGLGEPKFQVNGTRFQGAWARPQRDGPALRAITSIIFANALIEHGLNYDARVRLWPLIQNDLSYIGQTWNSTGFDIWEEVSGSSFFTTQVQYRALAQGADLARALGVECAACAAAPSVLCFLNSAYWNGEFFAAHANSHSSRNGLDASTILGPITIFDPSAPCTSPTLQPCHSKSLANFKVFVDTYRNPTFFPINVVPPTTGDGFKVPAGVALGRYPEDSLNGGNAWYLVTLGAAEFLYDAVAQWSHQEYITVDQNSLAFFRDLYPAAKVGDTYHKAGENDPYELIIQRAWEFGNGFLSVVRAHMPKDGSLSEQFGKADGRPTSAADLTWSYVAYVTMAQRRSGHFLPYWTQNVPAQVPDVCNATTVPGVYAPAVAAGAKNITGPKCLTTIDFHINATTYFGENIWLTGNVTELGSWNFNNAIPLSAVDYTDAKPQWSTQVSFTPGEVVQFKYVRQQNCNQPLIYEIMQRTFVVPPCMQGFNIVVGELEDTWQGPVGHAINC